MEKCDSGRLVLTIDYGDFGDGFYMQRSLPIGNYSIRAHARLGALGGQRVPGYRGAIKEQPCWSFWSSAWSKRSLFRALACSTNESWRYARLVW
jgi:hypothetical protein